MSDPSSRQQWYEKAFGPWYRDLYAHRNREDALKALAFMEAHPELGAVKGPVLDLCCGQGRHSIEMARAFPAFIAAMDLSPWLLADGRQRAQNAPRPPAFVRADMGRIPFQEDSFQLVLNLFTSFGYFEEESQNQAVFQEVSRVLRPGGRLLFDHIHPAWLRQNLEPESSRMTPSGLEVKESRRIDEKRRRVEKTIRFETEQGTEEILESVRFYEPEEVQALGKAAGLELETTRGGFDGSPLGPGSDRAIYVFHKAAPA